MHQKDAARHAWEAAGHYKSDDAKLLRFLRELDNHPSHCWPELVEICRTRFPEYKEQLAAALWQSGDKLLRLNLIRSADLTRRDEVDLLARFLGGASARDDHPELLAGALLGDQHLHEALRRRTDLPEDIREIVARPRAQPKPAPHPAPAPIPAVEGRRTMR